MSLLGKLFSGGKKAALERIAQQFDKAKAEYTKVLIEGLSDPDMKERQGCANIIRDKVVPALADDPNAKSRQLSLQTIQRLISELRPPNTKEEFSDFDNAVFFFVKRLLLEGQQ